MSKMIPLSLFEEAGRKGGRSRAKKLTAKRRSEIARNASLARWAAAKKKTKAA